MRRTFVRTPQACDPCRRRKTKCDGSRPRCKRCAGKNLECIWSVPESTTDPQPPAVLTALTPESVVFETPILRQKGLKACLQLFFDRHFASDFCSFDQRTDFEDKCRREPLLSSAVIALCSRYLSDQDAQTLFGLRSGYEACREYLQEARSLAKASSDQPSVTHVQGHLILAMAELMSDSGSRHWLFAGTAIRMAEVMRLNKSFHTKHGPKEQEIRRRTLWACLLLDRALAHFLNKHRTIDLGNVVIPVPGTDISLAYHEDTRGVMLNDIASHPRPSDLGLSPYLIKTICLWSDIADYAAHSRRLQDRFAPTDRRNLLHIRYDALKNWVGSLHPSLGWDIDNFRNQVGLSQGQSFVAMHFLLRSAACVGHQCYLPHLAMYTKVVDMVDAAGWSYLHRDQSLIEVCVSNALELGAMLSCLMDSTQSHGLLSLQSIWVAASVLIVANTFLWIRYAGDEAYTNEETQDRALAYWNLIHGLISSWTSEWKVAKQWLVALNVMQNLYKAAYLGVVDDSIMNQDHSTAIASDDESGNDFRPQPGDGYPSLLSMPSLQASVKFATGDVSARSIDIQFIWQQLSSGWPYELMEFDTLNEQSLDTHLSYSLLDSSTQEEL